MNSIKKRKFEDLISKEHSSWIDEAEKRNSNKEWLNRSFLIAMKILRTLRGKELKQAWLANELQISPQQVSKIVKGSENLTLETISKIEAVLGITLIEVPGTYGNIVNAAKRRLIVPPYQKSHQLAYSKVEAQPSTSQAPNCSKSNLFIVPEAA